VVEKVSGRPFGRFLTERILEPLAMKHSAFEPDSSTNGRARGYTSFALGPAEPARPEASGWLYAAGGLWASASDLARWDIALMEGRVLEPGSFRLMTSPRLLTTGSIAKYGCGLGLTQVETEAVLTHGGAVSGFLSTNAMVPRTKSAVILLSNCEHLDAGAIHSAILNLQIKGQKAPDAPEVPKIHGPAPKDAALDFLHQMQAGRVKRDQLGEEFSVFLTDDRLQAAAPRLKALGEPDEVEVVSVGERGGMEVASIRFTFKTARLSGLLYRSPDGKIQQLLFRKD
jgi:CubicO group peptidase (beta-lactamase class C family)